MKKVMSGKSALLLGGAVILLALVIGWLSLSGDDAQAAGQEESAPKAQPVSVVEVAPQARQLTVKATGITQAYWETPVSAAIAGRVQNIPDHLEPGTLVEKGQLLAQLQNVDYQAAVDNAASQRSSAQLNLATEQYKQTVILKTASEPLKTPYARHEPQVAAAKLAEKAAESALDNARQRLNDTSVRASFPAIILSRTVTPGRWVQAGTELFTIASSQSLDVMVELSRERWQRLGHLASGAQAEVVTQAGQHWPAVVRYLSPVRDQTTRQRSLVLKVDKPYDSVSPLLPGQLVTAHFVGRTLKDVWKLPASSLTKDGQVWVVDQQRHLKKLAVKKLSETESAVWVRRPEAFKHTVQVVLYPLGSMLEGQTVTPQVVSVEADEKQVQEQVQ